MNPPSCSIGQTYCVVSSMTEDKGILIKNIYYMLTYAFQVLRQSNYEEVASEEFENIQDLFAAILAKGMAQQLKQGLYREYSGKCEELTTLRGKLDLQGTIRNRLQRRQRLTCEYDELTENNIYNQILKTTAVFLLQQPTVSPDHKKALKKVLLYLYGVDTLPPSGIQWSRISFHKNNLNYRMLLNICYFVLAGLLLTTDKGRFRMAAFLDEQRMSRLYEKFVLEYYRYHYPNLGAAASRISWNVDEDVSEFLPIMQTDITLRHQKKILILDTKYYTHTMQYRSQYDSRKFHSENLYQIFAYVKNQDSSNTGNVAGMLLYAKTQETITPDCAFTIGRNKISVKTLDLNTPFSGIVEQLDQIVESYFGIPVYTERK